MNRRELMLALTGVMTASSAVRAQQKALPVIGFLSSRSPEDSSAQMAGFWQGLAELGYVEGENLAIEYRWARGDYERLPALAADLVGKPVRVLATVGGEPSALAAKAATSTIPIVFAMGDPARAGVVESYSRPGGNITGIDIISTELEAKRFGLLHDLLPLATTLGFLVNPAYSWAKAQQQAVGEAAHALKLLVLILTSHGRPPPTVDAINALDTIAGHVVRCYTDMVICWRWRGVDGLRGADTQGCTFFHDVR